MAETKSTSVLETYTTDLAINSMCHNSGFLFSIHVRALNTLTFDPKIRQSITYLLNMAPTTRFFLNNDMPNRQETRLNPRRKSTIASPQNCSCRGEKLWVPDDNESQRNAAFVQENFPSLARIQLVYLEREDGGDILTPEAFDKALDIHNQILALQWNNTNDADMPIVDYLPATQNITDLCFNERGGEGANTPDDCVITTPMMLFGYDAANWETRAALLDTLSNRGSWDPQFTRPGFILDSVFGSLQQAGGEVTGAKVLSMSYLLASNKTLVENQEIDEAAGGWELEFLNLMEVRRMHSIFPSEGKFKFEISKFEPTHLEFRVHNIDCN